MKALPVLFCAIFAFAPFPTLAQDFSGPLSPGAFESTLNMGPIAESLRRQEQAPVVPPAQTATPANLSFTPDTRVRSRVLASFVDNARKTDPATATELQKIFASPEFFPTVEKELGKYNLRTDNIADAYAVFWINLWQASRGITDDPSPKAVLAVKGQAERAMSGIPVVASASNADKQELADTLLIKGLLISTAAIQAKNNPEQMKTITSMALQNGREAGLDLASMTLTDQGFAQQ